MNKISRDTFDKLSGDLLNLAVTSQEMLEKLIDAVFDKALEDVFFQVGHAGALLAPARVLPALCEPSPARLVCVCVCCRTCTRICVSSSGTRPSTGRTATSRSCRWTRYEGGVESVGLGLSLPGANGCP